CEFSGLHHVGPSEHPTKLRRHLALRGPDPRTPVVGHPGLEPGTNGLKVRCSTVELVAPTLLSSGPAALRRHPRPDSSAEPLHSVPLRFVAQCVITPR